MASLQQAGSDAGFVALDRVIEWAMRSIEDSETAYFFDLLYLGECLTKVVTLGMTAGLQAERESHRYRVEHNLVRADGIGAWTEALDDVITGPASQALSAAARPEQTQLTKRLKQGEAPWASLALERLSDAARAIDAARPPASRRQLRGWFAESPCQDVWKSSFRYLA